MLFDDDSEHDGISYSTCETIKECHQCGMDLEELANEYRVSTETVTKHIDGNCTHEYPLLEQRSDSRSPVYIDVIKMASIILVLFLGEIAIGKWILPATCFTVGFVFLLHPRPSLFWNEVSDDKLMDRHHLIQGVGVIGIISGIAYALMLIGL